MAKLREETRGRIQALKDRFPQRRSAVLPALYYAQADVGRLDDETLVEIAGLLDVPVNMTTEVVGFYTMFDRVPRGKYKIEVCRNLSCALKGAQKVVDYISSRLGIEVGETTADGKFTLLEAECLGACGYAPMMMIGPNFYEFLDRGKVDAILEALREDKVPPVPAAGWFEKDHQPPPPHPKGEAVPTSAESIRDNLMVSAPAGKEEGK